MRTVQIDGHKLSDENHVLVYGGRMSNVIRPKAGDCRRGAAVAELALCIPIIFAVIFGSIEACNLFFLHQALAASAYDGALLGSQQGTTEAEILQRVQATLAARNITVSTVSVEVNGPNYDALRAGKRFAVHLEAPMVDNMVGPTLFATFASLEVDVVGHKQ